MKDISYIKYQEITRETSGCDDLPVLALGLMGETIEFWSALNHVYGFGISVSMTAAIENVTREAGDVLWYSSRIMDVLDQPFHQWQERGTVDNFNEPCMKTFQRKFRIIESSGSVAEHVKKVFGHGHEIDSDLICSAIGDVVRDVAYVLKCLHGKDGIKIAMQTNIEKLKKRYPDGFSIEKSVNRHSA
jgi:NTP pyrophosphatase (non-canonical NTP hydrolase)